MTPNFRDLLGIYHEHSATIFKRSIEFMQSYGIKLKACLMIYTCTSRRNVQLSDNLSSCLVIHFTLCVFYNVIGILVMLQL